MKELGLGVLFVALFVVGVYVKAWQCGEMFPQANLLACILWK